MATSASASPMIPTDTPRPILPPLLKSCVCLAVGAGGRAVVEMVVERSEEVAVATISVVRCALVGMPCSGREENARLVEEVEVLDEFFVMLVDKLDASVPSSDSAVQSYST